VVFCRTPPPPMGARMPVNISRLKVLHGNTQWRHQSAYAETVGQDPYECWGLAFGQVPIENQGGADLRDQSPQQIPPPVTNTFTKDNYTPGSDPWQT
jgi:hypothetical protein